MSAATSHERRIAELIRETVGPCPVLLCGSRALGTEIEGSDYDVVVVMPAVRIPRRVRAFPLLARRLEAEVGAPVSVNPLPANRLGRETSLFAWKLRREARVLAAPAGFSLAEAGPAPVTDATAFSYLASAALYLLAPLQAAALVDRSSSPQLQRSAHKCLLHVVQLRLLRRGAYAADLGAAVQALDDDRLRLLAVGTAMPEGLLGIRDALLGDLEPLLAHRVSDAVVPNARYAALSALRGRLRLRQALAAEPVDRALARAAAALLRAVAVDTAPDRTWTQRAVAALPTGLLTRRASWDDIRAVVLTEWPDAHPLGAL
ncbi:MAG: nucleotidyltransferase domain-containing protein [Thermoleophilia bacterium]|nr:nucleotidyltransferase domain-containing protein [Thermoleophilia bacterium]